MDLRYKKREAGRIAAGCVSLLKENKRFLLFPLISFTASAAVIISFVLPLFNKTALSGKEPDEMGMQFYFYLFLYYLLCSFITIFFNSALIGGINLKLKKENPGIADGLKIAFSHFKSILIYVFVSSSLLAILRILFEKAGWISRIGAAVSGTAFAWFTHLIFPAIITGDKDIFTAIKTSRDTMKNKWGEKLFRRITVIDRLSALMFLILLATFHIAKFYSAGSRGGLIALILVLSASFLLILSFTTSLFDSLYNLVLYRYASEGETASGFNENDLRNAFTPAISKQKS